MFGRKKKAKKTTKKKPKRKAMKGKKKPFGGYHIKPDAHLAKIIGSKPVTPSEMTKKIWQYIKKKKLANK